MSVNKINPIANSARKPKLPIYQKESIVNKFNMSTELLKLVTDLHFFCNFSPWQTLCFFNLDVDVFEEIHELCNDYYRWSIIWLLRMVHNWFLLQPLPTQKKKIFLVFFSLLLKFRRLYRIFSKQQQELRSISELIITNILNTNLCLLAFTLGEMWKG